VSLILIGIGTLVLLMTVFDRQLTSHETVEAQ
jgi:hypothetical protein